MLRAYTKLRQESPKGKEKRLEFERAERAVLRAAKYRCKVKLPGICDGAAVTAHHRRLRSQGGDNSESNLVAICRPCHKRIHNHPAEAAISGHVRRRTNKEVSYAS